MKKSVFLLVPMMFLTLPLTSCGSSETSDKIQFVVTYELVGETPQKRGVYISSAKKMDDSNYRIDVLKLQRIKKYHNGVDGSTIASSINGSSLEVGDLLTINLKKPTRVAKLKSEKYLEDVSSMTAVKRYGATGTVGDGEIEFWGANIAGNVDFKDIPLFLSPTLEVIEPETIPLGTKGYGGYYSYTSFKKFFLAFVVSDSEM